MENDANMQGLAKAQQKELKEELLSHRTLKTMGSRPSNRSAALDYRTTVEKLNTEVSDLVMHLFLAHATTQMTNLSERTGALAIAFFSRGHLDDDFEPN